jgi:uncharacterized protein (TIGR00299 family) protein
MRRSFGKEEQMLAYLDCFSGISGDMILGALIAAGADPRTLRDQLRALPLEGYSLDVHTAIRHGIEGIAVRVTLSGEAAQPARTLADVLGIIADGALPQRAHDRARQVFERLAAAEARVHGVAVDHIHFHEVGAVDAVVDIVGAALALEMLDVDELWCSELPLTTGRVRSAHGELPVPAPATIELLRETGAVWHPLAVEGELVTPTGAAIAATLARFERPQMRIASVGYGFGTRDLPWANCLRVLVGPASGTARHALGAADTITVIQTNIDDMTGEALGWLMEHLLGEGALDVSFQPAQMKKNRPGALLTVLAPQAEAERLAMAVLRSSSTLGVRMAEMRRVVAGRRLERISSPVGEATVKLKIVDDRVIGVSAEYEDARALSAASGIPVDQVIAHVEATARAHFGLHLQPRNGTGGTDSTAGREP